MGWNVNANLPRGRTHVSAGGAGKKGSKGLRKRGGSTKRTNSFRGNLLGKHIGGKIKKTGAQANLSNVERNEEKSSPHI